MSAIATIGHNHPPEPSPFDLSKQEIEDLFLEAANWCDGASIKNEAQAAAVTDLLDQIQSAIKTADTRRTAEKQPHDEAVKEIQARWNTLIGETKAVTGRAILAKQALQKPLLAWRQKVEAEKRAAAEAARREAEEARRIAQEALRASDVDDLAARADAELMLADAAAAEKQAKKADKAATSGLGMRSVVTATVDDVNAFLKWAWVNDRPALEAYAADRAAQLVRAGQRAIPGVTVNHEQRVV